MHFEIVVEDQSGKKALDILIPKIIGNQHSFEVHAYKGSGRIPRNLKSSTDASRRILLDQLPKLLRGRGISLSVASGIGQRVLLPVSTNHTVCSMILKSSLSDMFSM